MKKIVSVVVSFILLTGSAFSQIGDKAKRQAQVSADGFTVIMNNAATVVKNQVRT